MEPKPPAVSAPGSRPAATGPVVPGPVVLDPDPDTPRPPGGDADRLRRCAALAEVTPTPVIVTRPDGRVDWINPACAALAGLDVAAARGRTPGAILGGAISGGTPELAEIDAAAADGRAARIVLRHAARPLSVQVHPLRTPDGAADGCLVVAQAPAGPVAQDCASAPADRPDPLANPVADPVAEGAARTALATTLDTAIESLPDGFMLLDAANRLVLCNEHYRAILAPIADTLYPGAHFADILRAGLARGMFPEAEGREDAWLAENLAHPPPDGHAFEIALSNGRWLRIVERPTPDGGRVGLRIDITAQVESRRRAETAEAEARLARAQLLSAVEALPDGFILFDADDRLVLCNARLRALYPGMADAYVTGTRFGDLLRRGLEVGQFRDIGPDPEGWLAARLAERALPAVTRVQRMASGQVLRVIDRAMPDGGRVGLRIDITELVEARRELADMIAGADAGTFRADLDTGALVVNDRWAAMLGHDPATLGPMDLVRLRALTHPEDRARLDRSLLGRNRAETQIETRPETQIETQIGDRVGDGLGIEVRLRHRDGRDVWALMRARVTGRDAAGLARTLSGLTLDITDRRRREGILQAVASSAERILGGGDWLAERATMLAEIGRAADVDRCYYFGLHPPVDPALPDVPWSIRQEVEWCRDGITPQMGNPDFDTLDMAGAGLTRMQAAFRSGQPFVLHARADMTAEERALLEPQGIEALSLHPVTVGHQVAGFLGFDLCRPDPAGWRADAIDALTAAAHICSAALDTAAAQARLREARDRAEAASRSKSDFLATMSHEIRTPLNGVLGVAELLETAVTEPEHHRMLGIIRHSGQTLLALLNDLLDMSRIEAGRLPLEQVPFVPAAVARRLQDIHAMAARDKGLAFEMVLGVGCDTPRLGDAHRVQQILHNLLGNAVKFTEAGHVRLQVHAPAGAPLVMCVRDTGIGMSGEQRARIFDSFTQADTSISRRYGGSGLGMSIVRRLVDLMGGGVTVDSAPGAGTTVTVSLPLPVQPGPAGAGAPEGTAAPPRSLAGLRVLAADDNAANRFVLQSILGRLGVEAVIVSDGTAAVAAALDGAFDAILLDISMPGLDGPGALRAIRAAQTGGDGPPIVAVTANAMADQVADYLCQGFAAHVAKPFGAADLRRALDAVLPPGA